MTFGSKMSYPSSKTRISAIDKLKESNAAKLELETKKMEERIRSLKEKMMKEKEERERLGGTRWSSGRTGPLTKNVQKFPGSKKINSNGSVSKKFILPVREDIVKNKISRTNCDLRKPDPAVESKYFVCLGLREKVLRKGPRKIKLLTDEPVDNYIRKPSAVTANASSMNPCGQCEKISSVWLCHECSEKYCDACFNQFHLKGALRRHTKTRVGAETIKESEQESRKSPATARKEPANIKSYGTTTEAPVMRNDHMNGLSLLNGNYDEEESANSFAQALQEWRNQNKPAKMSPRNHPVCIDTSCGTSNEPMHQDDKKELTIKFNSSISYGDRLYLKKNRETNLASPGLLGKVNVNGKKGEREANQNEIFKDDRRSSFTPEEKENSEEVDTFAPSYREMIQNIATVKSKPSLFREGNMPSSQSAVSVEEISPVDMNTHYDEGTVCIVDECEKEESNQTRPTSRHGAITICEMYSARNPEQDLKQTGSSAGAQNYVSPSITSKPFFLKPTGKVTKKQPARATSAGRRKTPRKEEQRKDLVKREQSPNKRRAINESPPSPIYQSNKSNKKQLPLKKNENETIPRSNHMSPRPPSNPSPTKNKTRIPVRQAWKAKPSHKELSSFFLAGVDEDSETLQQNKEVHCERSFSKPITNLGRGSLSSTWNPVESYPQISTPDSIDMPPGGEISTVGDSLELTDNKFEEFQGLPEKRTSNDNIKHNSSNDEDEALELTALDDFDTGNQDDDDLATLNDLAWELESSTGRLTRCEDDLHLESDDDSIEDKDAGSGLTTPCTLERSFRESIMDDFEEMERKFMEEEF